jgi:DNA-binding NarL/FixJ family response regulator
MSRNRKVDPNQVAAKAVAEATGTAAPTGVYEALLQRRAARDEAKKKNAAAVALGRIGGLKGGKARAAALSPQERKEIARKGAKKRWENAAKEKKANSTDESQFLLLKKQGLTVEQIGERMNKSPAQIAELILRLVDQMAVA